jgi:predicted ATPase/class 3 adenylate cyclase/Tfp pilus assembly protein PilF
MVTFLFTDIEGSTALWERSPVAMRTALAHHDELLRDAIESSDGCIVKSTGDGVHAVFAAPADALAACLTAQRRLQASLAAVSRPETTASEAQPPIALKVRMGLHTGAAELRNGDYFGTTLNRAARIMSAAHGGQVLLSAATAELVRGRLPEYVTLREMGEHRLKGLLNSERLLQVVVPDLRADFPPLESITSHSLPAERDAFVGRLDSLADLTRRLDSGTRLISVVGLGGTGKTRLVTRFGWRSLGEFPGGVWFCDLSEARNPDDIAHAVAQGLDVPLGKDEAVTQIGRAIAGRGKCLVILDNFEQVARHAEETLGRWLNRASSARFLATTREVLGLPGEEVIALPPLGPSDAVALFTHRAEAAKPGFEPSPEDQAAIVPLVNLLEGLPLAIELAAARVRVMPPRMLLVRMNERFKLLSWTGSRLGRQSTLRAVFDWSWDLLSLPEKAALAQLSVFAGGFRLESVEAVLDLSTYENPPWPIDALQSLVHKSLVRQVTDDRFDLLVSVQEYAAEHLRTEGRYPGSGSEALFVAEARHGDYFADLNEKFATANIGAELDNFVVACRRAAGRGHAELAANALERAWSALRYRGPFKLGIELANTVRAVPGCEARATAVVEEVTGSALAACGRLQDAYVHHEAALACAGVAGDRRCECRALRSLGLLERHTGRLESARVRLDEALVIARELKDKGLEGLILLGLGELEYALGRMEQARTHYEPALVLSRDVGDRELECMLLCNLGNTYGEQGRMDLGRSHFEAALGLAQETGNRRSAGILLSNVGWLNLLQGQLEEALGQLNAALAVARDLGYVRLECDALGNLGTLYERMARGDEALIHYEAALVIARELGERRWEGKFLSRLGRLHARQSNFAEARLCLDAGEAMLRAVPDRMSLGILLCSRAETEHLAGIPNAANVALAEADAIAAEVGAGVDSELGLALAVVRDLFAHSC